MPGRHSPLEPHRKFFERAYEHLHLAEKFDEICSAIGIDPRELETQKPLTAVLSAEEQAYFDSRASLISKLIGDGYEKAASVICSTAADFISILNSSKLTQKIICPEWFEDIIEKYTRRNT